jgi:hypothetical protein
MGALVEDKFDADGNEKKRTTGQILWIRGLTRLQTQVRQPNKLTVRLLMLFTSSPLLSQF